MISITQKERLDLEQLFSVIPVEKDSLLMEVFKKFYKKIIFSKNS